MASDTTTILHVGDLHCDGCARTITRALYQQPGVRDVTVDVAGRSVRIEHDPAVVQVDGLRAVVEGVGYTVAPPA